MKKVFILLFFLSFTGNPCQAQGQARWGKPLGYTFFLFAVEFEAIMLLGWNDYPPSHKNVENAFKHAPRDDDDPDIMNLVMHPLMGSETYLRAREANFGIWGSFWFSMGASVTWEYLVESWIEHPSRQDLMYTTGIGWVVGELRYQIKRATSKSTHWIIDPINSLITHVEIKKEQNHVIPMLVYRSNF